ncbi:hypothetical protein L227DRAFT_571070 [Lentinus tigrinus ALCF2SS1-6]|uniref:Uncharacterized protein n=1 Tax=Lentinus tigrinus ALCF2SS1-6 TaxID=1328759 RepID=A0A5C2SL64_9APHY|nr:hypothetical protein L227DRAFT_571070 [Lentinus tigrinus ALCF2SS1-6]
MPKSRSVIPTRPTADLANHAASDAAGPIASSEVEPSALPRVPTPPRKRDSRSFFQNLHHLPSSPTRVRAAAPRDAPREPSAQRARPSPVAQSASGRRHR